MKHLILILSLVVPAVCTAQDFAIASGNQTDREAIEGYTIVKANARAAWDFTRMAKKLFETKDTVLDFSGNSRNAFRDGTTFNPIVVETMILGGGSITAAGCENTNVTKKCYVQDGAATNLFNTDFEIHLMVSLQDGQIGSQYLFGLNNGAAKRVFLYVNSTGTFRFDLNLAGSTISEWESAYVMPNNITGVRYIRLRCDFANDIIKMWVDGVETTLTLLSGDAFNLINPSGFTNTWGTAIGGTRTSSTSIQSGNGNMLVYKAAVTGLLTNAQAVKIAGWFTYLK